MADNIALSSSTSTTVASDDIGGVQYQRVKISHGADGSATDVSSASPMPVTQATQPLPTGAATAAKQPALGTAGAASTDVLTVQGIASMTPLKVDGSATTQPVSGTVTVNAIPAGTNTIGNVGLAPRTSGGCSTSKTVSAASTNATVVKASAGHVYGIIASNVNAAVRYLKLYDSASSPTVGTTTIKLTIPLPGATTGGGVALNFPLGIAFSTGIAFALTTEATDAGTTGVSASESVVNIIYA